MQQKLTRKPDYYLPASYLEAKRAGADEAALLAHTHELCRKTTNGEPDEGWVRTMYEFYETAYRAGLIS